MTRSPTLWDRARRVAARFGFGAAETARPWPLSLPRRAYGGASGGRLLNDMAGTPESADKSMRYQAPILRRRARELRENSPLVARYAQLVRDNLIGPDGITLQAIVPSTRGQNVAAGAAIEMAWYRWAASATADGQPLDTALRTVAESWRVEGEALLELQVDASAPFGLTVRPLDADLLDETYNLDATPSGGKVVQGVEFDAAGRIVRYHLWTQHPSHGASRQRREVPPSRLLRLAHRPRPGQTRGVTPLAPGMVMLRHLEKTEEALVVLNRVVASKMGALVPGDDAQTLGSLNGQPELPPEIEQAPGQWWTLPKGWDVKMLDPGQPTQNFEPFAQHLERSFAASVNVAYASLTGDTTALNYSTMRSALLLERDGWMVLQAEFVETIMRPLFRAWLQAAWLVGAVTLPAGQMPESVADASVFHPRRWPWVDPLKDAQAVETLLALGLTTRTREANKQGLSFDALLAERAREEAAIAASGVTLGTAPSAPTDSAEDSPLPSRMLRVAS